MIDSAVDTERIVQDKKVDIISAMAERDLSKGEIVQEDPEFVDRVEELRELVEKVLVIDFSDLCEYLLSLKKDDRLKATSQLGNVFNTCIGGVIRSPKISKILGLFGCRFSNAACLRGYSLQQLEQEIRFGDIEENKVKPKNCRSSVDVLFLDLDNTRSSDVNSISLLTSAMGKLNNSEKIQMTIVILLSDENDIESLVKQYFTEDRERLYILNEGTNLYH